MGRSSGGGVVGGIVRLILWLAGMLLAAMVVMLLRGIPFPWSSPPTSPTVAKSADDNDKEFVVRFPKATPEENADSPEVATRSGPEVRPEPPRELAPTSGSGKQPDPPPKQISPPSKQETAPPKQDPPVKTPGPFRPHDKRPRPALLVAPFDAETATKKQAEWATFLKDEVEVQNSLGMKLRLIPAGTFPMGMSQEELDALLALDPQIGKEFASVGEQLLPFKPAKPRFYDIAQPAHTVTLSRPFYLAATETTRGKFLEFVKATDYETLGEEKSEAGKMWFTTGFPQTNEHPVVRVTWNDANAFCEWLSKKEGKTYRLPTEAEREFACRAGVTTLWLHGNSLKKLQEIGNFSDAIKRSNAFKHRPRKQVDKAEGYLFLDGYLFTAPVGQFEPNAFGLFDMYGNVGEWCSDWFDPQYYKSSPEIDPQGPTSGNSRSVRGGSWYVPMRSATSSSRGEMPPTSVTGDIGFRVLREVE